MSRVYNFSPGPATIPESVLKEVRDELLDWQDLGMSVMEVSHRSSEFIELTSHIEKEFRALLSIPDHYKVLFLPGGATVQFSVVPMNLLRGKTTADYIYTGIWSHQALNEAKRYCNVNVAASSEPYSFHSIPDQKEWKLNPDAAYVHYTSNETIGGLEFNWVPEVGNVPLVCDMSSSIMSESMDVNKFGLIYAAAQKNMGPAGFSVVVVREDLLGQAHPFTPSVYDYHLQALHHSIYNTPPTFSWYLFGKMVDWIKAQGGVTGIAAINQRKAKKLYDCIDASSMYENKVDLAYRSRMNVPFTLPDKKLETQFLHEAKQAGLKNLKGHRLVGGIRVSIYNPMPEKGVDTLIEFMRNFEKKHG